MDVSSSDTDIMAFLENSIHKPAQPVPGLKDPSFLQDTAHVHDKTCFAHVCHSGPHYNTVLKFVRAFAQHLEACKLKTGALLALTNPDFPADVFHYLLGVTSRRPFLQTLVEVKLSGAGLICSGAQWQVTFGHSMFSNMAEKASSSGRKLTRVHCKALGYSATLGESFAIQLKLQDQVPAASFTLDSAKSHASNSKPRGKLPFGLKMPRASRKKPATRLSSAQNLAEPGIATGAPHGGKDSKKKKVKEAPDGLGLGDKDSESDLDIGGGADAGSDSDVASTIAESDSDSGDNTECDGDAAPVDPVSDAHSQALAEAKSVAVEIEATDTAKAQFAKEIQAGSPASTYFSRTLGLARGAIAPTSRSKCHMCQNLISKGSVRFEWYYNRLRPNAWIHCHCVIETAKRYDMLQQVTAQLRHLAQQSQQQESEIAHKASRILSCLQDV